MTTLVEAGKGASITLFALICALCISAGACATQPRNINIPPGELATALESVAQQADVELIFQPDQLKGLYTEGVVGMMTARQAAEKLLEGTRFQVRTDPDNGAMMVGATAVVDETSPGPNAGTAAFTAKGSLDLTPQEEVEITARRAELSVMREEMVKLEDRFYAEYNRLNSNHWWDVVCYRDNTAANGRFKFRVCRPRFVDQGMRFSFGSGWDSMELFRDGWPEGTPNRSLILERWADYEKNMRDQLDRSLELRRLVSERELLEKRYESVRKQAFKGKIIVLD